MDPIEFQNVYEQKANRDTIVTWLNIATLMKKPFDRRRRKSFDPNERRIASVPGYDCDRDGSFDDKHRHTKKWDVKLQLEGSKGESTELAVRRKAQQLIPSWIRFLRGALPWRILQPLNFIVLCNYLAQHNHSSSAFSFQGLSSHY